MKPAGHAAKPLKTDSSLGVSLDVSDDDGFSQALRLSSRRINSRHMIALGQKLVALFDAQREDGTYQLFDDVRLLAQTTHTLSAVAFTLPMTSQVWSRCVWRHRPLAANAPPADFSVISTTLPFWLYGQTVVDKHWPAAQRKQKFVLKKMPNLHVRYLKDRQLMLLMLMKSPLSVDDITRYYPELSHRVETDLLALLWSGCLMFVSAAV
ncbi:MAG: hypothetical protein H7Z77_01535 [Chitinophagaceae bacterium]|nr:hypothetical protein [Polaromonas sp.]